MKSITTYKYLCSLVLILGILILPVNSHAQEKPIGKVISIIGTVEYSPESEDSVADAKSGKVKKVSFEPWEKVTKLQPVYAKDRFRTSRKSRLKVLFSDNSLMALGPDSEMSVMAYRHQPKSKLRQGVIKVKRGLSMYIVNKSQKHKKSFFNIISPTATIGARGTQGYVASSPGKTLVANQAGAVATKNNNPRVRGVQVVGTMMKNVIARGQPPSKPSTLQKSELKAFRNLVLARIGPTTGQGADGKSLIEVEETEEEDEEEEEESEESEEKESKEESEESEEKESEESDESEEKEESAESEESSESEETTESEESSESSESEETAESSDDSKGDDSGSEDSGGDDSGDTKTSESKESQDSKGDGEGKKSGPGKTADSGGPSDTGDSSASSDSSSGPSGDSSGPSNQASGPPDSIGGGVMVRILH